LQLDAEALAELVGIGGPVHPEKFDFAGIGRGETFADFNRCCFAGPIWTEQAEAFAGADFEVETVDGDDILVGFAQTGDVEGWLGNDGGHEASIAFEEGTCNLQCAMGGIGWRTAAFGKAAAELPHSMKGFAWWDAWC
jgi:hypothetical protein